MPVRAGGVTSGRCSGGSCFCLCVCVPVVTVPRSGCSILWIFDRVDQVILIHPCLAKLQCALVDSVMRFRICNLRACWCSRTVTTHAPSTLSTACRAAVPRQRNRRYYTALVCSVGQSAAADSAARRRALESYTSPCSNRGGHTIALMQESISSVSGGRCHYFSPAASIITLKSRSSRLIFEHAHKSLSRRLPLLCAASWLLGVLQLTLEGQEKDISSESLPPRSLMFPGVTAQVVCRTSRPLLRRGAPLFRPEPNDAIV